MQPLASEPSGIGDVAEERPVSTDALSVSGVSAGEVSADQVRQRGARGVNQKLLAEWFWIDRWMASSAFLLPMEARGLYREMLSQAWLRGARLPNNEDAIQRAVGAKNVEWRRSWPVVQRFWRVDGDSLVNDTQVEIYSDAIRRLESASSRGVKGAQARARTLAQRLLKQNTSTAQDEPEHKPPISVSNPSLPERSPEERVRARGDGGRRDLAFAGKVLHVPKFLDEEFVNRINGCGFDLTGFYLALDERLAQTGESWDLRWIRDQFAKETPQPERVNVRSRRVAEQLPSRRSWRLDCHHEPPCNSYTWHCIALEKEAKAV